MNRTVQDIYPLSPAQRGMLFHSLYHAQSGVYVVQVVYTLQGPLNRDAFEQAWQQLVERHSILRTAFVWDNLETPVQVVGQQVSLPIAWQDWQYIAAPEQQQRLSAWLVADRQQGFQLSAAPLMRLNGIQLGPDRHRIIWTHHHILLDGWSLPTLLKEWLVYYQANDAQQSARLSPALPYRDYIGWLQQQDLVQARQFWRAQLTGITAPTSLGIDRGPSPQGVIQSQTQLLTWTIEQTQQLRSFAQQHRLTLSSVVQGVWAKLLSCYSGDESVLYGLACSGRPSTLPMAEHRVGLFINTLPMAVQVPSEQRLIPCMQQLQIQQLAIQPYEYTPLVEIRAVSDIPNNVPLFESVVVFENYPIEPRQSSGGLALLDVDVVEQTHYPLMLFVTLTDTLQLKLLFDAQRFTEGAISRLLVHFQSVLSQMLQSVHGRLQDLRLLTSKEQQQLSLFGSARVTEVAQKSAPAAIAHQADQYPENTAVIFAGESLSYGQLNQQANQLAHYLIAQGISSRSLIGLCVNRSMHMVVALLAILKAGCAYVPLDPTFPTARLQYMAMDAGLDGIICHADTQTIALDLTSHIINLSLVDADIQQQPTTTPHPSITPNDLAYLIYTSGSTGQPKGVPIQHQNLSNLLSAMADRLDICSRDTFMAVTTLSFDIAALELFLPLISGARLLLASDEMVRDGHQLIAHLDTYGVDLMQATPATWRLMVNCGWSGHSGLRMLCGGEALDIELAQRLLNSAEQVWNVYGPTETTIWSSALSLSKEHLSLGTVPIGAPIDNTQFYVLDRQQQPVPIGVTGELYIGGKGLAPGYWHRSELTAEKFIPNPLDETGQFPRLYRTGDRVRYREDGTLDYLGRFDQQAKLRGYRIELGEIEAAIATHASISQAVVVILGGTPNDQRLVAYVTPANQELEPLEPTLRSHLSTLLPPYMVPSVYQILEAFPLTPNGKVDRKALPRPMTSTVAQDHQPQTSIETTLAEIWRSLLQRDAISIYDNFFEVGGHSLLVVNAQIQIRQRLGVELSLMDLFSYPTISTLATFIGAQQSEGPESSDRTVALATGKQRLKQRLQQRRNAAQVGGAQ